MLPPECNGLISWLYKWLPIICGCHCRDDRSFHYRGRKFPICARCTGELLGIALCLVTCYFYLPPAWAAAAAMVPMVVDGTVQLLTRYESTNFRRVVTGFLFGYALCALATMLVILGYHHGYSWAKQWRSV